MRARSAHGSVVQHGTAETPVWFRTLVPLGRRVPQVPPRKGRRVRGAHLTWGASAEPRRHVDSAHKDGSRRLGPCYARGVTEEAASPYVRFLAAAIEASLDELLAAEQIELEAEQRAALVTELLAAAARAETPKRMIKALVKTVVGSDHVEEIYAGDDELRDVFNKHIEQP